MSILDLVSKDAPRYVSQAELARMQELMDYYGVTSLQNDGWQNDHHRTLMLILDSVSPDFENPRWEFVSTRTVGKNKNHVGNTHPHEGWGVVWDVVEGSAFKEEFGYDTFVFYPQRHYAETLVAHGLNPLNLGLEPLETYLEGSK